MKKIITLLVILTISSVSAKSFVDEVSDIVGVSPEVNINLGTGIINALIAFSDDEDAKEVSKIMKNLDKIRVSVFELDSNVNTDKLNSLIQSKVSNLLKQGYESIVTVKDKSETVNILAKVQGDSLEDVMLIVMDEGDEMVVISLQGLIDLAQIAELTEHFDVDINDIAFN
jgi:hypothetical protein